MSKQSLYIEKSRTLASSENYKLLRSKGMEYIEKLSSAIWTDYNIHDPGVTILEMLCYAITDLGYRTQYTVDDILAEDKSSDTQKLFFTAREILTCSPVTVNDFRKILIDLEGIKNAWLEKADQLEQNIYVNCEESKLTTIAKNEDKFIQLKLSGVYDVVLELEEDDDYGDLNLYSFERTIKTGKTEFTICLVMPSWEYFFKVGNYITDLQIVSIQHAANSQNYSAILKALINGKELMLNAWIKSTGETTGENEASILKELKNGSQSGVLNTYKNKLNRSLQIAGEAYKILHEKRNLCEDFYSFKGIDIEHLLVCADIEVKAETDIEKTLAEIYHEIDKFINPQVRFYTIEELTEKGKTTDQIFEGPALDHGFIDEDELEDSDFTKVVHVSDLVQIIMDIENVIAVKDLIVSNRYKCETLSKGNRWCLKIQKGKTFRLDTEKSQVTFYKGLVPYNADENSVSQKLHDLELTDRPQMLAKEDYDIKVPEGKSQHIKNYYSLQNDFPLCYGIGKEGLMPSVSAERKAQAKQLKGFLLLFDQILADFLEQLAHVKHLFSTNPKLKKTYFSHNMIIDNPAGYNDIPNIHYFFKDFIDTLDLTSADIDDYSTYEIAWTSFISSSINNPAWYNRENILETEKTFEDRRNRFLDHLMARFAEQFTDYVLLMYKIDRKKADSELIEDKIAFLDDYHEVSYNRAKAFNYISSETWNTLNVTGLERRVARILGINNYRRRWLYRSIEDYFEIYTEKDDDSVDEYRFRLPDAEGNIILSGTARYHNKQDAVNEIRQVIKYGRSDNYYEIRETKGGQFYIVLTNGDDVIARLLKYFKTKEKSIEVQESIIRYIEKIIAGTEGFHLIEHVLLRPRTSTDELLRVCVNKDCKNCPGFIDPYSLRATAVVPYWPERFRNFDFRKFFETTIRMEAPAHVHIKICWVTQEQMQIFETAYKKWLSEISSDQPDNKLIRAAQDKLVKILQTLRSVYPETRLYDCEEQDEDGVVLLDHSVLGSISEDENGSM
ncbi:MAG: YegP family protein [Melioribacteraceae bacterium]|nr:YegP family protein [Melioribacteraceae bacterium]